jgi:hypothetical protein
MACAQETIDVLYVDGWLVIKALPQAEEYGANFYVTVVGPSTYAQTVDTQ